MMKMHLKYDNMNQENMNDALECIKNVNIACFHGTKAKRICVLNSDVNGPRLFPPKLQMAQ